MTRLDPSFETLPLPPPLQATLQHLGFLAMTPIQAASLPLALAGRDVLATAATGSGKTGAYAFAALQRIDGIARPRPRLPRGLVLVLVLVPTRRQNLLFSATFPPPVEALAQRLLHDPVRVDVGHLAAAVATRYSSGSCSDAVRPGVDSFNRPGPLRRGCTHA